MRLQQPPPNRRERERRQRYCLLPPLCGGVVGGQYAYMHARVEDSALMRRRCGLARACRRYVMARQHAAPTYATPALRYAPKPDPNERRARYGRMLLRTRARAQAARAQPQDGALHSEMIQRLRRARGAPAMSRRGVIRCEGSDIQIARHIRAKGMF